MNIIDVKSMIILLRIQYESALPIAQYTKNLTSPDSQDFCYDYPSHR